MRKLILLVIITVMGISVSAQGKKKLDESLRSFNDFYEQSLKDTGIVGSSFMLVHEGKVAHRRVYGMAHIENKYPVDEDTIFHWASITKTFTGIAIMQLRDRGKLSLDDPIVKYVPELERIHNSQGKMSEITIRQLLSHTAGFRAGTFPWGNGKDWEPAEPTEWAQLVAMMPYNEIGFKPGSKFSYSNPAYVYLGVVIERLTGDDFEVYADKNILRPLGMHNSYFDATPYHLVRNRSHSYSLVKGGQPKPGRFDMDSGITVANSGLNSPFPDMLKYMGFLMGDQKKQRVYDAILKRSSLEEMWQPQIEIPLDANAGGQNRKDAMGLAYFLEENYGQRFIGHSGSQNHFISHFYLQPESKTAYVVAFNTEVMSSETAGPELTRLVDRSLKDHLFEKVFPLFKK